MMVLPAHMTWMCCTRSVHCIGSSCASASAFSRARLPSVPVERAASQPCMRVKKSSPGRMKADLLSGSLFALRGSGSVTSPGGLLMQGSRHTHRAMMRIEGSVMVMYIAAMQMRATGRGVTGRGKKVSVRARQESCSLQLHSRIEAPVK